MKNDITDCPITNAMQIVGGKWKMPIIYNLGAKTHRFGELKRALSGITQQMLSKNLKELEGSKLVIRKVYPQIPPKVEYSLSEKGKSILPVLESIKNWSESNIKI